MGVQESGFRPGICPPHGSPLQIWGVCVQACALTCVCLCKCVHACSKSDLARGVCVICPSPASPSLCPAAPGNEASLREGAPGASVRPAPLRVLVVQPETTRGRHRHTTGLACEMRLRRCGWMTRVRPASSRQPLPHCVPAALTGDSGVTVLRPRVFLLRARDATVITPASAGRRGPPTGCLIQASKSPAQAPCAVAVPLMVFHSSFGGERQAGISKKRPESS